MAAVRRAAIQTACMYALAHSINDDYLYSLPQKMNNELDGIFNITILKPIRTATAPRPPGMKRES